MRLSSSRSTAIIHRPQQDFLLWDRAGTRPSLDQQFADRKDLIDAISGQQLITHTRASAGTYVGSDGLIKTATTNEARFDHDPTTGESLGLLVEESRTNLLTYSEEFDDASWTSLGLLGFGSGSIANAITAPDGTLSADLITEDTSTGAQHAIFQVINVSSGATVTFSVYLKASARTFARLIVYEQGTFSNNFSRFYDLSTGSIGSSLATGTAVQDNASITPIGDGWYRCEITGSVPGATSYQVRINIADSITTASYTGDGTSGIYLWGAQLEEGSFPTSYIPTEGSTVTRAADVASITGANFSSWYRQDEGTIYHSYAPFGTAQNRRTYSLSDGTGDNQIRLVASSSSGSASNYVDITTAGAVQGFLGAGTAFTATPQSGALGYILNNTAFSRNGAAVSVDTSVTIPVVNKLDIGSDVNNSGPLNGTIRRLTYWPTRLGNDTLQAITQ